MEVLGQAQYLCSLTRADKKKMVVHYCAHAQCWVQMVCTWVRARARVCVCVCVSW